MSDEVKPISPSLMSEGLGQFIPEPSSSVSNFGKVLTAVGSVLNDGISSVTGIDGIFGDLINQQMRVQMQMQSVSMESNIEKSKHETQMAAIRNFRVG